MGGATHLDGEDAATSLGIWSKTKIVAEVGEVKSLESVVGEPLHVANHLVLAALMQRIDEVLSAAEIPYWLSGGSLIGALRHGNIIPHDDDIDIECLEDDIPRISAAIRQGIPHAFLVHVGFWCCAKVYQICVRRAATTFGIDVFPRPSTDLGSQALDNPRFPFMREVFPLKRCSFAGSSVNIPGDVSVLTRLYGPRWHLEVHVWKHYEEEEERVTAPLLLVEDYERLVTNAGYSAPTLLTNAASSWECPPVRGAITVIHATRCREYEQALDSAPVIPADPTELIDASQVKATLCDPEHHWRQQLQIWLLHALGQQLSEAEIPYWGAGRTLSGALWYEHMVPYDSTVTIECYEEDMLRVHEAARQLHHITVTKQPKNHSCQIMLYEAVVGIRVDVHGRPRDVTECLPPPRYPSCWLSEADIFPLRLRPFAGMQLPCPAVSNVGDIEFCACDSMIAAADYKSPTLASWESLSASGGPLERLLWAQLGWASPLGPSLDQFE